MSKFFENRNVLIALGVGAAVGVAACHLVCGSKCASTVCAEQKCESKKECKAGMSTDTKNLDGILLGCGNPLLDISASVPASVFSKYDVKLNNAILAEAKHVPIFDELVNNYEVTYVAGGATQNTIRVFQWMVQSPGASSYIGAIGRDKFGDILQKSAQGDGVSVYYRVDEKEPTGTCAVLIKDRERSLIANLAAANTYKIDHLTSNAITPVWQKAQFFYSAGFFLTVSPPSMLHIAQHAHTTGKTYMLNLSAPFICQFFKDPMMSVMPYVDFVFGNESEAAAFAQAHDLKDNSPRAVAYHIAGLAKENKSKPRTVVITNGSLPTVVVHGSQRWSFSVDVPPIPSSEIIDSNGAGDAFVGGFISQLVRGRDLETCVRAGHYSAGIILRVSGVVLPKSAPTFVAL
jgi:adenosine kinase